MNPHLNELLNYLDESVKRALSKLSENARSSEVENPGEMLNKLLNAALKNEWETAQLTSHWVLDEKDHKFAVLMTRLAGDEAKHYLMIEKHVAKLAGPVALDSPLFKHLQGIKDTFERLVTGPFTREYLAVKRNELFLEFCEKYNFTEVLETYKTIQEEEAYHHRIGVELLDEYLKDEGQVKLAKQLIDEMLKVVDDMQEMVVLKKGLTYLPGC